MNRTFFQKDDTIIALSSPTGIGAIALIRLSGKKVFAIVQSIFSKKITEAPSHTLHFGKIKNDQGEILDEVLVGVFKNPHSYTGEDVAEISCHGSMYVAEQILQLLLQKGARLAEAGEFTRRAYLNGKLDLAQAEAVADLIASESAAAHRVAIHQLKGGFSSELKLLREKLLNFVSLIELELDFAEEDVEFADRSQLKELIGEILQKTGSLIASFRLGNAIKKGVPVAIVGKPNAGKSTLLNALLGEEKAIVSPIAGTTRDVIEDSISIQGIQFRFMDTAGLRETEDAIEKIGVARALEKMKEARVILYLYDSSYEKKEEILALAEDYRQKFPEAHLILLANKIDLYERFDLFPPEGVQVCAVSAKTHFGLDQLKKLLVKAIGFQEQHLSDTILTNLRHVEALRQAENALNAVLEGLEANLTGDFLSLDIRNALHHIGSITGEIHTEEILGNIFSKFCIGK